MSEFENKSLSVKEYAQLEGIGLTLAYELFNTPEFPSYRQGRSLRVSYKDAIAYRQEQKKIFAQEKSRA